MKTYGERRSEIWGEDFATNRSGWKGRQSRALARRRKKDSKILRRRYRRANRLGTNILTKLVDAGG